MKDERECLGTVVWDFKRGEDDSYEGGKANVC